MTNPLRELEALGQSIWLDYLDRSILENGALKRLIDEDGLSGLTSNPSIFEKAIGEGAAYDERLKSLAEHGDAPEAIYERLAVADIQHACDLLRPTHDRTRGRDGFASLEVSPRLANDSAATIEEARRLWQAVDRPNVMIKVPGTPAGPAAIRRLVGEGINVNVTLLFGVGAYLEVAEAHMAGLEALRAAGGEVGRVHGVASFFVSRIDTKIDKAIDARLKEGASGDEAQRLQRLRGRVAIANAKRAYQRYLELIATPRWRGLLEAGAAPQRLLWASTGVKDPAYPETHYAEALIGPDTVDTLPPKTMDALRARGQVAMTLAHNVDEAERDLAEAQSLGLDLDRVTNELIGEGVEQFAVAFDKLLSAIAEKSRKMAGAA
jgi:transaldolase/glucose-6-phosphate isomerase